jgi:predicted alpha/beta-hydrolase family hydrolase
MSDEVRFEVPGSGVVSGLMMRPASAGTLYVLAHGAGAGMRHPFLEGMARSLAGKGVATFRYQFPYMEQGKKRPDSPGVAHATVRAAAEAAREAVPDLPVIAGGKSFGGRMTSSAQGKEPLPGVRGLAFLGFPLHPRGKSDVERAAHLRDVHVPMLFLQGTRDTFAQLDLLHPVVAELEDRATLHEVEGGDHSFKVLKRSGRTEDEVRDELTGAIAAWAATL